jgi:hypothetical protein
MARKHDSKGRSKHAGRFVAIPHFLMETAAWRTMPVYERAAFLEVAMLYNGTNNGFLDMAVRNLAERLGVSPNKANRALQELVRRGFLEVTELSAFSRKDRTAQSYRLTHKPCDRTRQAGSRAYLSWQPETETTVAPRARSVAPQGTVTPRQSQGARP